MIHNALGLKMRGAQLGIRCVAKTKAILGRSTLIFASTNCCRRSQMKKDCLATARIVSDPDRKTDGGLLACGLHKQAEL